MSLTRRKKVLALTAGAAIFALTLAGCSDSAEKTDGASTDETPTADAGDNGDGAAPDPVSLTIATFNTPGYHPSETDAGYEHDLIQEYMDLNEHVTITYNRAAESGDARENFFTKLGPGGLADIEMVEVDWMPEVMQYADLLADLSSPSVEGRWVDYVEEGATDAEGRLIGYGTDTGPQGVCYRADLFEAAGLPTDPAEVAAKLEGDWDNFFAVGDEYVKGSGGKAFFDSTGGVWQGMVNQLTTAYEDADTGEIIALDNQEVKAMYDQLTAAGKTQSSPFGQWSEDWFAGLSNDAYATMLCPPWMLGVIEGNSQATDWNLANAYPNGGGNWGGSWLTVPANGANVEEATKFIDWLTAPEQQAKAFANAGTYPSQVAAYDDPAVTGAVNEFFNGAPIGEIFAERAQAVVPSPYKGEFYFPVNDAINNALSRVQDGIADPASSWDQAVADIEAIG